MKSIFMNPIPPVDDKSIPPHLIHLPGRKYNLTEVDGETGPIEKPQPCTPPSMLRIDHFQKKKIYIMYSFFLVASTKLDDLLMCSSAGSMGKSVRNSLMGGFPNISQ
jgi:hypothetical protein